MSLKIYLADDADQIRQSLKKMLTAFSGVSIAGEAGTVPRAIEEIAELKPDLVILDIRMPGGSGLDVLREIRRTGGAPTIIILTNFAAAQYRERALSDGADYFFDKSTEFEEVLEVIRQMLDDRTNLQ